MVINAKQAGVIPAYLLKKILYLKVFFCFLSFSALKRKEVQKNPTYHNHKRFTNSVLTDILAGLRPV